MIPAFIVFIGLILAFQNCGQGFQTTSASKNQNSHSNTSPGLSDDNTNGSGGGAGEASNPPTPTLSPPLPPVVPPPVGILVDISVSDNVQFQNSEIIIGVELSQIVNEDITLSWQTKALTAVDGVHFNESTETLTIPMGSLNSQIHIPILQRGSSDATFEFQLTQSSVGNIVKNSTIALIPAEPGVAVTFSGKRISVSGRHSCVINEQGAVKCWGNNSSKQLGVAGVLSSSSPVQVPNLKQIKAIATYDNYSCALDSFGAVWCWGGGNETPSLMPNLVGVKQIVSGRSSACAIDQMNELYCWGNNRSGVLGDGTTQHSFMTPVKVKGLNRPIVEVGIGQAHACALNDLAEVWCWGNNETFYSLGQPSSIKTSLVPLKVPGLSAVSRLYSAYLSNVAVLKNGDVIVWGGSGSLASPTNVPSFLGGKSFSMGSPRERYYVDANNQIVYGPAYGTSIYTTFNLNDIKELDYKHAFGCAINNQSPLIVYCWLKYQLSDSSPLGNGVLIDSTNRIWKMTGL